MTPISVQVQKGGMETIRGENIDNEQKAVIVRLATPDDAIPIAQIIVRNWHEGTLGA